MTMPENIFEYAVANKLRFPYKGAIAVEDLYDLTTQELDTLYKKLRKEQKTQENEESLLAEKSDVDIILAVKIEIVKYIVNKKLARIEEMKSAKAKKDEREKLMALISQKKDAELSNLSVEELEKRLADLG